MSIPLVLGSVALLAAAGMARRGSRADEGRAYLSLAQIDRHLPEMERLGVSEVARSPRGFLAAYRAAGGDASALSPAWRSRREGFIARHMAQVRMRDESLVDGRGNLTRRHLALIAWAYSPFPAVAGGPAGAGAPRELENQRRRGSRSARDSLVVLSVHAYPPPLDPARPDDRSQAHVRTIAHALKRGYPDATALAAVAMRHLVPPGATLIPLPGSDGTTTTSRHLARAIAGHTGSRIADILTSPLRQSSYQRKKRGERVRVGEIGTRVIPDTWIPTNAVLIDNVVASGVTAEAANLALGRTFPILCWAASKHSAHHGSRSQSATTTIRWGQLSADVREDGFLRESIRASRLRVPDRGTVLTVSVRPLAELWPQLRIMFPGRDDARGVPVDLDGEGHWDDRGPAHAVTFKNLFEAVFPDPARATPQEVLQRWMLEDRSVDYARPQASGVDLDYDHDLWEGHSALGSTVVKIGPPRPGMLLPPVVVDADGFVDGRHRLFGARLAGLRYVAVLDLSQLPPR